MTLSPKIKKKRKRIIEQLHFKSCYMWLPWKNTCFFVNESTAWNNKYENNTIGLQVCVRENARTFLVSSHLLWSLSSLKVANTALFLKNEQALKKFLLRCPVGGGRGLPTSKWIFLLFFPHSWWQNMVMSSFKGNFPRNSWLLGAIFLFFVF